MMVVIMAPNMTTMAQEAAETAEAIEAAETSDASVADIVAAANTFLDSLDDTQREAVLFDFEDEAQRENWSNFPTGIFYRAGLSYTSLTEQQRDNVMALLQVALSAEGYDKVIGTMVGDEILRQEGGNGLQFGYGLYFVSILGTPSETEPWILQWGGHHLALNVTFAGTNEILSPSHTGCQPCTYIMNDQEVDVLGDEYNKALALVNALDAEQQEQAVLDYEVSNLILGPGEEERVVEPEGLAASEMTDEQQAMLLDVISEWVNIAAAPAAEARMAQLESQVDEMYFAWSGDTGEDSTSYFRISGPTLWIEFAPQGDGGGGNGGTGGAPAGGGTPPTGGTGSTGGPGGDQTGVDTSSEIYNNTFELDLGTYEVIQDAGALYHVHTIYRDPTNPYGSATISESTGE
jgi:hypothetical protein